VCTVTFVTSLMAAAPAAAQTFKVAQWNLRGGQGVAEIPGQPHLFDVYGGCAVNAWGSGYMQNELVNKIKNDPDVIALGLNEWYGCAGPTEVQALLGWAAHTNQLNGNGIIAKFGFPSGFTPEFYELLPPGTPDQMYVVYAQVCRNSACSATVDVFLAHWGGGGQAVIEQQAIETRDFMASRAGTRPRVFVGDLNVWDQISAHAGSCSERSIKPWGLQTLRDAGYKDAWKELRPTEPGYTQALNRNGCGIPNGAAWRRIDYVWSLGMTATAIEQIGVPTVIGETALSDHLGLKATFTIGTVPPPDTTPPTVTLTAPANGATVSGTISVAATASDNVAIDRVEFWLDGQTLLGTDTVAPYSTAWNTTSTSNGSHSVTAKAFDTASNHTTSAAATVTVSNGGAPGATWTNVVNASASGGTIEKTSGCTTCADAGGHTTAAVPSSGGYAEFVPSTGTRLFAGLGTDTSNNTNSAAILFGFSFWENNAWDVREGGVYKAEGTYVAGDVFRVAVESGQVKYYKNGALVYTSEGTPGASMVLDATLITVGAKVMNAVVSGGGSSENPVVWATSVNAAVSGNTLQKNAGCEGCGDAGGVAQQQVSTSGWARFTATTVGTNVAMLAGLASSPSTPPTPAQIRYGFSVWPGAWEIREQGVYVTDGTMGAGDSLKIVLEGSLVKYYVNDTLVWTSSNATGPYSFAAHINSIGSSLTAFVK
jgi:hypothetical protein